LIDPFAMENNLNTDEIPTQPTAVITLLPGELWCIHCGNDGNVYAGDSRVNNVRMCSRRTAKAATWSRPSQSCGPTNIALHSP
jgi:hypothetical protein